MTPDTGRNRLAQETSPYLLQHAANPVDWFPWGEEAFAAARTANKPIMLSVGYSTCHWCHVMAHESFEDAETAALMNASFVSIKVDREERPDIDSVYMTFTQAMTGQGGWPMTVFLTPEREPFYAGTYFPPDDAHGRPGFRHVLESIRDAWATDPDRVRRSAGELTAQVRGALAAQTAPATSAAAADAEITARAVAASRARYDAEWGGFGRAPKFPSPSTLEFLLAYQARVGEEAQAPGALEIVLHTLRRMAAGGIYDQLGGGFSRYSVDQQWRVPHFEKMLYDNAQLARVYLHAYQITGDAAFERIARETVDYLAREMLDADGGFYSAQDADSEGIEGKFFVWTVDEIDRLLGDDAAVFNAVFNVTPGGNFEDPHHPEFGRRNVLTRPRANEVVAREFGIDTSALAAKLAELRERTRLARDQRVHPGRDDKVLTSWNGLALAAFAEAGRVLDDARYRAIAERNAAFVRERLWREGRLLHTYTYKAGASRIDAMLEDYAYYGLGLVELFRANGDLAQLRWAAELFEIALHRFHDDAGGGFFEAPLDGEALVLRQKPLFDASTPSGNGAIALLGFWLGRYFERAEWERTVDEVAALAGEHLADAPTGFGSVLHALDLRLAPRREVAIVGEASARAPLERALARRFLPAVVIAPANAGDGLPLLVGRGVGAGALAYVCRDMVCDLPVSTAEALAAQLAV